MAHAAIAEVRKRLETAKQDSDFTYFYALLLEGEALFKTTVLGYLACIVNDPDRHRYRLEREVLHADGLGPWARALEDALVGPASQFLLTELSVDKNELTKLGGTGTWQHSAVTLLKQCMDSLGLESEDVPAQTDMIRWFRLFATLRNKTRGHGATMPSKAASSAACLDESIDCIYTQHSLFQRQWAYLYLNLSGKHRVTAITDDASAFNELKKAIGKSYPNGVYIFAGMPRMVALLESDADLTDFFFPNGSFAKGKYECLSYATDNKKEGNGSSYLAPLGKLPGSETQGLGQLELLGECFSNAPPLSSDYIPRPVLEAEIERLTTDDRHPIITLVGRGGIGKTSLALKVLNQIATGKRFQALFWFSARDVDLQFTGPKPVKPHVMTEDEVSRLYVTLVEPKREKEQGFSCRGYFEAQLGKSDLGPCLFVFDNFETTSNPDALFAWIDTHIRLPNKALITTRLRDFRGDYPVEVKGMTDDESRSLIETNARQLGIMNLLNREYVQELIMQAEGHPYVIKILLGEVAKEGKAGHIERLVAGRDEILTALFERTYASLPPCAQRTFMTLAAWNSAVPRVALEAVLQKSGAEVSEVERGVDLLLQYSLAERKRSIEGMDFVQLPLVALFFGRKKLNVSQFQAAIKADAELLQMLGTMHRGEVHFSLAKRMEVFLGNIAKRVEKGDSLDKYAPIVEMIARHFPRAWLLLARMHMEDGTGDGYEMASGALRRFLEEDSASPDAAEAWRSLSTCFLRKGDVLGHVHALVQRSKIASVPFSDLTSTARWLNDTSRRKMYDSFLDEKRALGEELLEVMHARLDEACADDLAQMAWIALRLHLYPQASEYVKRGLALDPDAPYLRKLAQEPNISV